MVSSPKSTADAPKQKPAIAGKLVEYEQFIDNALRKTRRNVRSVDLAGSVMAWVAAALAYLLVAALLDHWVVKGGLGVWARVILFAIFIGAGIYYFARHIVPLVLHRINPLYAAHTIERSKPSLKNSLVNFLLFRADRHALPDAVYSALERQAATNLAHTPVDAAVDRTKLIRIGYVLLGVLLVGALYVVVSPKSPFTTMGRVIMPWADIQAPTRVVINDVQPGDVRLFRGQQATISAEVMGLKADEPVTLYYTSSDGQAVDRPVAMTIPLDGYRYTCSLPAEDGGLQQSLTYHISAGDATSREHTVEVVSAPTIVVEQLDYVYPQYTGLAAQKIEHQGDIKALEGTQVTIRAVANQDIQSAAIDFDCDGSDDQPMKIDGQKASATFTLELQADRQTAQHASYQVRFKNTDGRANPESLRYQIAVTPDLAPEVQLLAPRKEEIDLPADRAAELEIWATDPDFGLQRVNLLAAVNGQAKIDKPLLKEVWRGQLTRKITFRPDKLKLKAGDIVEYWATAEDNKQPTPNRVQTRKQRFKIISPTGRKQADQQLARAERPRRATDPDQQASSEQDPDKQPPQDKQKPQDKNEANEKQNDKQSPGADVNQDQGEQKSDDEQKSGAGGKGKEGGEEKQSDKQGDNKSGAGGEGGANEKQGGQDAEGKQQADGGSEGSAGKQRDGKGGGDQPAPKDGSDDRSVIDQLLEHRQEKSGGTDQKNTEQNNTEQKNTEQKNTEQKNTEQNKSGEKGGGDTDKQPPGDQNDKQPGGAKPNQDSAKQNQDSGESGGGSERGKRASANSGKQSSGGSGQSKEGKSDSSKGENRDPNAQNDQGNPDSSGDPSKASKDAKAGGQSKPEADGTSSPPKPDGPSKGGERSKSQGGGAAQKPQADDNGEKGTGNDPSASPNKHQKNDDGQPGQNEQHGDDKVKGRSKGNGPVKPKPDAGEKPSPAKGDNGRDPQGASGQADAKQNTGGPPDAEGANKPREKVRDEALKPEPQHESEAQSKSKGNRQGDAKGSNGGELSGRGKEGGGAKAQQPGTGGAGTSTAADDGGGTSNQQGKGDASGKPGEQEQADTATGKSGSEPGKGSDGKSGKGNNPGGTTSGNSDSPDGQKPDNQPGAGSGAPTGGGQAGGPDEGTPRSRPQVDKADEANLDYARKATDLALEHLRDQLDKDKPDQELLDRLGWTRDDLEHFLKRWQAMQAEAKQPGAKGKAARDQLDDTLRSLGLRPRETSVRGDQRADDRLRGLRESHRTSPPAEYLEQSRDYTKGISRGTRADR